LINLYIAVITATWVPQTLGSSWLQHISAARHLGMILCTRMYIWHGLEAVRVISHYGMSIHCGIYLNVLLYRWWGC